MAKSFFRRFFPTALLVLCTAGVSVGGTLLWQHYHPPAIQQQLMDMFIREEDVLALVEENAPAGRYGAFAHWRAEGSGLASVCYRLPMPYEGKLYWLIVWGSGPDADSQPPEVVALFHRDATAQEGAQLIKEYYNAGKAPP